MPKTGAVKSLVEKVLEQVQKFYGQMEKTLEQVQKFYGQMEKAPAQVAESFT